MQATVKLDNATFQVSFYERDDEFTGACMWEVKRKQLADVWAQEEFETNDFDDLEWQEFDEDDDPDETIHPGGADSFIVWAAAASQCKPAEYKLEYHGSPYWFFHDLIHAEYDSGDGSAIFVNEDSEMRALPMGAKLAAEHGVSISEILKELCKAQPDFKERFGFDFDAVDAFVSSVELVIK